MPPSFCSAFASYACALFATSALAAATAGMPPIPQPAKTLEAKAGTVAEGEAWLTKTADGSPAYHLNGPAKVAFDLAPLQLDPGYYKVGFVVRTGTRWTDATDQIPRYRLHLQDTHEFTALGELSPLLDTKFAPIMDNGLPDAWGNWYGSVQHPRPLQLQGDESLLLENLENHGGIRAIWIQPVRTVNSVEIELSTSVEYNAFLHGQTPTVDLHLHLAETLPPVNALVELVWLDLLTGSEDTTRHPLNLQPGETETRHLERSLPPGVYRLTATIVDDAAAEPADNPSAARRTFAYSPARLAKDLPDNWPLAAHVDTDLPPLPGFRWYRYFAQWPEINPEPARYEWTNFDQVFEAVKKVGGRMLIASDGAPVWTSSRGKAGMNWAPNGTAYPPDDWQTLRDYLDAMLQRYADPARTLGAIEHWNEANTKPRWLGDTEQMPAMARVFREAAETAHQPVQVVGLAISAGNFGGYAKKIIEAGMLEYVDAISAHFYEEIMSFESETPINNMPWHIDMLKVPMEAAGYDLPMLNTESGIGFVHRETDRLVPQHALNAAAEADPEFDPAQPWMVGKHWREVSERRAAASYVSGTVFLMAHGVRQSYYFSQFKFLLEGAPSLPWVALGQLGNYLYGVDYTQIRTLEARYPDSEGGHGDPVALAFLLGAPGEAQVLIAWGYHSDTQIGRSKVWQPWLKPQTMQISLDLPEVEMSDLYGREFQKVRSRNGILEIKAGEEPVFIRIPAR